MPVCPYTLLKPVFQTADAVLQRVNAVNGSLRPHSNLLFGLFSLNVVLALNTPAFMFGGPDQPVDTKKVGAMRDGSVQFSWFYWKPFLANLNLMALYCIRNTFGVDWWTDSLSLAFLALNTIDRIIAMGLGAHSWQLTLLGGISQPKFKLIPKEGNAYDAWRVSITEWKYEIVLAVRRLALSNLIVTSLWQGYLRFIKRN